MGISKDFRDYYGGKESQSLLRPSETKRQRTRGEKIADTLGRGFLVLGLSFLHTVPLWATVTAFTGSVLATATQWWLERKDKQRAREIAA